MRRDAAVLLKVGCILIILTYYAICTASAAVVPFKGTDYSWLTQNDRGEPTSEWVTQAGGTIGVRPGDMMQFQNRWYNGYSGTADIRISYGGIEDGICTGGDEYVYYGLNYGGYYPSDSESLPQYSTTLITGQGADHPYVYNLTVVHQYVCNGVMYGSGSTGAYFEVANLVIDPNDDGSATSQPGAATDSNVPKATETPGPSATAEPTKKNSPSPGFSFDSILFLAGLLAIVHVTAGTLRRMRK